MFRVPADESICFLVEALLPRHSHEDKGLHIELTAGLSDGKAGVIKHIHFVFQRPSNYTKVFVRTQTAPRPLVHEITNWEFICDHDSCWRDAVRQELAKIYFKMAKSFNKVPIHLIDSSCVSVFSPRVIPVKVEHVPGDNYAKKLLTTRQK